MNNLLGEDPLFCVRCGRENSIQNMKHTRLHGYMCFCGSQEWREREKDKPLNRKDKNMNMNDDPIKYLTELKQQYVLAKTKVMDDIAQVNAYNTVIDRIETLITRLEMTPLPMA